MSLFCFLSPCVKAQDLLRQKVSIAVKETSIKDVLVRLEAKCGCYFSYSGDVLKDNRLVTFESADETVESVLMRVLGNVFQFQVSGKHVVITAAKSQGMIITGRLVEAGTGNPIEMASVYEKSLLVSTLTGADGRFKLHLKQPIDRCELVISKLSFEDTILHLQGAYHVGDPIVMNRATYELDSVSVLGVQGHWLAKRFLNTKEMVNSINLNRFFARQPFQFSALPGMSSKNRLTSQTINKVSFNLIGGYTAGVSGFELGLAFNIVQRDMQYTQIAGGFNVVGGAAKGVQVGGLYNYVGKDVKGVQVSGVFNAVQNTMNGVQVSGLYNSVQVMKGVQLTAGINRVAQDVNGVQITGLVNQSNSMKGLQIAALANANTEAMEGVQVVGVININDSMKGVQCAGFVNYTHKESDGIQIAGVANVTRETVNGVQVSGMLNYAKRVNGTQIGLINIADTTTGLSIGLISIILKGKHSFDFNVTEWQPLSISYKSGTDRFYNIFQLGGNLLNGKKMLSIGYGIGSASAITKKVALVQEFTVHTVHAGNWNDQNILGRYQIMLECHLNNMWRLYTGPAVTALYHESTRKYEGFMVPFEPSVPSVSVGRHFNGWLGWTIGVSFF